MNNRIAGLSPFSRLKVKVTDVDYDFSDGDLDWSVSEKPELPTSGTFDFMAEELFDLGIVERDEIDHNKWLLDEEVLEELISDRITSDTEFCHNGFKFSYSVSR